MKKFLLIAASISLLAASCNSISQQTSNSIQPTNNQVSNQTQTSTAGWTTYTNTVFNFSFKYPSNMIKVQELSDRVILDTPQTYRQFQAKNLSRVGDLIVYVDPNPTNSSFNDFYKDRGFKNTSAITVGNNISAYQIDACAVGDPNACVIIPADKNFIEFTSFMDRQAFHNILSAFTFTK